MKHIKHQCFFKYVLLSFLGIFFSAMSLSAQELLTLKRATELVIENNLQIKQAQFTEAISEENLQQSKLALLPTLNANTGLNFNFGRSIDPLTNQFVNQAITSTSGNL